MACSDCTPFNAEPASHEYKKSHEVVASLPEADILRNVLVTVLDEGGAVYHIDEVGNYVCVSRPILFQTGHLPSLGQYKNAVVYDFTANKMYVYNPEGAYKTGNLT